MKLMYLFFGVILFVQASRGSTLARQKRQNPLAVNVDAMSESTGTNSTAQVSSTDSVDEGAKTAQGSAVSEGASHGQESGSIAILSQVDTQTPDQDGNQAPEGVASVGQTGVTGEKVEVSGLSRSILAPGSKWSSFKSQLKSIGFGNTPVSQGQSVFNLRGKFGKSIKKLDGQMTGIVSGSESTKVEGDVEAETREGTAPVAKTGLALAGHGDMESGAMLKIGVGSEDNGVAQGVRTAGEMMGKQEGDDGNAKTNLHSTVNVDGENDRGMVRGQGSVNNNKNGHTSLASLTGVEDDKKGKSATVMQSSESTGAGGSSQADISSTINSDKLGEEAVSSVDGTMTSVDATMTQESMMETNSAKGNYGAVHGKNIIASNGTSEALSSSKIDSGYNSEDGEFVEVKGDGKAISEDENKAAKLEIISDALVMNENETKVASSGGQGESQGQTAQATGHTNSALNNMLKNMRSSSLFKSSAIGSKKSFSSTGTFSLLGNRNLWANAKSTAEGDNTNTNSQSKTEDDGTGNRAAENQVGALATGINLASATIKSGTSLENVQSRRKKRAATIRCLNPMACLDLDIFKSLPAMNVKDFLDSQKPTNDVQPSSEAASGQTEPDDEITTTEESSQGTEEAKEAESTAEGSSNKPSSEKVESVNLPHKKTVIWQHDGKNTVTHGTSTTEVSQNGKKVSASISSHTSTNS